MGEVELEEGYRAFADSVLAKTEPGVEGDGGGHVGEVGVEDDAGVAAGGDAGKGFGDEGCGRDLGCGKGGRRRGV